MAAAEFRSARPIPASRGACLSPRAMARMARWAETVVSLRRPRLPITSTLGEASRPGDSGRAQLVGANITLSGAPPVHRVASRFGDPGGGLARNCPYSWKRRGFNALSVPPVDIGHVGARGDVEGQRGGQ